MLGFFLAVWTIGALIRCLGWWATGALNERNAILPLMWPFDLYRALRGRL